MNRQILKNIASIQTGLSFRSRIEPDADGNAVVIQMKDLTRGGCVECAHLHKVSLPGRNEQHLVKRNDLIFRSRGLVTTSAILKEDLEWAVVAAPLFRIRVTDQNVLPEYLNWFIAQESAQGFLIRRAIGTAQKMISKDVLQDLEIVIPTLDRQQQIIELAALEQQEQALLRQLAEKREEYVAGVLMQLAKGESDGN